MSEHVIREYFLKADASFRTSDAWHKAHDQQADEPDPGKPRIIRTGRFGIGALAMFLFGRSGTSRPRSRSHNPCL